MEIDVDAVIDLQNYWKPGGGLRTVWVRRMQTLTEEEKRGPDKWR